ITLSKTARDTSPEASSPSRKRQLTQIPLSSRAITPHFSHFAGLLVALGIESDSPSEFFIRVTRLRRRGPHIGTGSRLPRPRNFRPCARLHRAAGSGNAAA